jgi:hypothetical protein
MVVQGVVFPQCLCGFQRNTILHTIKLHAVQLENVFVRMANFCAVGLIWLREPIGLFSGGARLNAPIGHPAMQR